MDEYEIPIHGLTEGIHNYSFDIKASFFEYYNNPDLPGGHLKVDLCLNKKAQFLEFDFQLTGALDLVCDRCLEVFPFNIDLEEKLFVRFGNKFEELDDNIIVIPREESRFNISQYLYEFAALSVPYKKVHPETTNGKSGCDPEMIKRLNELKVEEKIDVIDPRWDKLKNLN
jgi:uncharacterized metal-binding protein YceD (DUF177 family)